MVCASKSAEETESLRCGERTEQDCERVRACRRSWEREWQWEREVRCECDGDDAVEIVDDEEEDGMGDDRTDSNASKKDDADNGASRSLFQ